jgi:hypothetical protein
MWQGRLQTTSGGVRSKRPVVEPEDFFEWIESSFSPSWLQPFSEPSGSTQTEGMVGPDSSSLVNASFGQAGLVESARTAVSFSGNGRIIYTKTSITDQIHQSAGGTFMIWARPSAGFSNQVQAIYSSNATSRTNHGISLVIDDRTVTNSQLSMALGVMITRGVNSDSGHVYYSDEMAGSSATRVNVRDVVIPGQTQMYAFSHSFDEGLMRLYVDGEMVRIAERRNAYSTSVSTQNPAVGASSAATLTAGYSGVVQGLVWIPSILSDAQIQEIYTRSGGPFA